MLPVVRQSRHVYYFSTTFRLALQCGDSQGSYFKIFVNGMNIANFTVSSGSYLPDQYRVNIPNGLMSINTVEFR
jgi:hypothetical protein